jgi:NAD(P)-dependent dehydrogenase (short-subunit alcohol dehydrogenase family)
LKAVVTGAARGIGAAIAGTLAERGVEVVKIDLLEGGDHQLDVARDRLPDLSDIDVCVSNAAITTTIAPAHRMTAEQWQRDIDVNLTGAFRVVQACLPGMRERRFGRVVVISSGAARAGLPGQVAYAASKAGLLGMVKTIAAENAGHGITANAILPGMVDTEAVRAMPAEVLERVTASLPTGRMARPEEVAALVAFLASEQSGYVTGEEIGIDGGIGLNTMTLGGSSRSG